MKYTAALILVTLLAGCSGKNGGVLTSSGTIEGTDVKISAEITGKVKQVRVDEGSRVAPGDTLIVVEDTEYRIQLRQSIANLASFESAYRLAVEGSRKEDIVQAEASFKTAEADYLRMKELLASQSVTQKQYDDSYSRYVTAQQTYEKLKRGLRPEEVENARQKRDLASAQVDLWTKKLRDCTMLAPSGGTITLRAVEPGEVVSSGMNVLRITSLDKVKLTIYVNEQELGMVRLGQAARVSIDSSPGKSFGGTVTYISPTAEFTPKNVQTKEERTKLVFGVKIEVPNPDGALKPGLPADAVLEVQGKG
jgi:HlyD family secretion protein